jgi:hypothetical protein
MTQQLAAQPARQVAQLVRQLVVGRAVHGTGMHHPVDGLNRGCRSW